MRKMIIFAFMFAILGADSYGATQQKVIGATVGDFADLVRDQLQPELQKRGFDVKLVEFTDYVQPNIALSEGSLDLNIFQHKPYLEQFSKERHLELVPIRQVPTAPLGLYAGRKKSLKDVTEGSTVAVPNDPTNLARALVILADLGWVELPAKVDHFRVTPGDLQKNFKKLKIVELEAAQIPRALQDVDYAVINGNYVVSSGLSLRSALVTESTNAYVNWAVARKEDLNSDFIRAVKQILDSMPFRKYARAKFKDYKYPDGWK